MDGNVLSEEPEPSESISLSKIFEDACPYYMSIGMTPEQYWCGEPALAVWYRESFRIKKERRNWEMWLQGMYIYDAICDASPILRPFANKKGTRAVPYPSEPYDLGLAKSPEEKREKQNSEDKKVMDEARMRMENLMVSMANKLKGKGGNTNG